MSTKIKIKKMYRFKRFKKEEHKGAKKKFD